MSAQSFSPCFADPVEKLRTGTGGDEFLGLPKKVPFRLTERSSISSALLGFAITTIGTGGMLDLSFGQSSFAQPTGASRVLHWARNEEQRPQEAKSPWSLIVEIRAAFGLSVSQLAEVLKVKRQTVYLWLDSSEQPRIQLRNRQRLIDIHALATAWNQLCSRPAGRWLHHTIPGLGSLLDLMSTDRLEPDSIQSAMRATAAAVNAELNSRVGTSIAQRLRQKGFSKPPTDPTRSILAHYTDIVSSSDD